MAVMPFNIRTKLQKKRHFKNAHCEFYEQFSCGKTHVAQTKRWSRIQSLSESHGGTKVTKPMFSNSAKQCNRRAFCMRMRASAERQ